MAPVKLKCAVMGKPAASAVFLVSADPAADSVEALRQRIGRRLAASLAARGFAAAQLRLYAVADSAAAAADAPAAVYAAVCAAAAARAAFSAPDVAAALPAVRPMVTLDIARLAKRPDWDCHVVAVVEPASAAVSATRTPSGKVLSTSTATATATPSTATATATPSTLTATENNANTNSNIAAIASSIMGNRRKQRAERKAASKRNSSQSANNSRNNSATSTTSSIGTSSSVGIVQSRALSADNVMESHAERSAVILDKLQQKSSSVDTTNSSRIVATTVATTTTTVQVPINKLEDFLAGNHEPETPYQTTTTVSQNISRINSNSSATSGISRISVYHNNALSASTTGNNMAAQIASTTTTTTTTTINDGEIMSTTRTTLEQSPPPSISTSGLLNGNPMISPIPLGAMASAFNSRAGSIREGSIREGPIITELADDEEIDPSIPVMSSRQNSNTTDFSTAGAGGRRGTSYSNNIPNILSGMKRNASVSSQAAGLGGMADSGAAAASAGLYTSVSDSWNNSDLVNSGTLDNNGSTSSTLMSGLGWGKGSKVPAVANVRSLDGSGSMGRPTTLPPQAQANSRSRSNVSAVRDIHGSATTVVPATATATTATTAITAAAAVAGKPSKPPQFDEDAAASGGCGCFGFLFGGKKKAKKP